MQYTKASSRFVSLLLATALCCFAASVHATEPALEQGAQLDAAAPVVPIHELPNEDLLEQAQRLSDETTRSFLAELRALATNKTLIDRIRSVSSGLTLPPEPERQGDSPAELKELVDQTDALLALHRQKRESLEEEMGLWTTRVQSLTDGQRLAHDLLRKTEQLDRYLIEIRLRISDNTLDPEAVPDFLRDDEALERRRRELRMQETTWQQQEQAARLGLKALKEEISEADKTVVAAEVENDLAKKDFALTKRREELREQLTGERPDQLLARIKRLEADREWLNGAFRLANGVFASRWAAAKERIGALDSEAAPDDTELLQMDDELYETALEGGTDLITRLRELLSYFEQRQQTLEQLQTELEQVIEQGDVLQRETDILTEHLFNLGIYVAVYEDREDISEELAPRLSAKSLNEQQQAVADGSKSSLAAYQEAVGYRDTLSAEISKSRLSTETIVRRLGLLEKAAKSHENVAAWRSEFGELSKDELLARYEKTMQSLQKRRQGLNAIREKAFEQQSATEEMRTALESLHGPLFRPVQELATTERRAIEEKLYQLAELELPARDAPQVQEDAAQSRAPAGDSQAEDAVDETPGDPLAPIQHWGNDSEKDLKGVGEQLELYQGLLSSQLQITREQQQRRGQLLEALEEEKTTLDRYGEMLNETLQDSRKTLIAGMEIQRRLARQEMERSEIPAGMIQAMDRDTVTQLEAELGTLLKRQNAVQRRLSEAAPTQEAQSPDTNSPGERLLAMQEKVDAILELVGRRLDRIEDRRKLLLEQERKPADFSETEEKNLQQAALRRLEAEDTMDDWVLRFFASERAQASTDLLQAYYEQVVLLEGKLSNLEEQQQTAETLAELTAEEEPIVQGLIPLFQESIAHLKADLAQQQASIEAALLPHEAKDIIADLESQTGRVITAPPAVSDEDRADFVAEAVEELFDARVKLLAVSKWQQLFEHRASRFGIDSEAGVYQDEIGAVKAAHHSTERQLGKLQGRPPGDLADLKEDERPRTEKERLEFLEGEIGITRSDRRQVRQRAALWALVKLFAIVGAAVFLVRLIELVLWRPMEKRAGRPIPNLVRGIVAFIIYLLALFAIVAFVFGQTLAGLLATSGVVAMVIGLAVQMNISNIFSGLAINLERPFNVGDWIKVDGIEGKVIDINWRATRLHDTVWDYIHTIPNHAVAEAKILNYHDPDDRIWTGATLHLPTDLDPKKVEPLLSKALSRIDGGLKPWVMFAGFSDWSAQYWVYLLVHGYDKKYPYLGKVWDEVWKELEANDIAPVLRLVPMDQK